MGRGRQRGRGAAVPQEVWCHQGLLHTCTAIPRHVNTPALARHHGSLLERWQQQALPWQLHVVPAYKPSRTLLHLTATNHLLAHGHLSIKKKRHVESKITLLNVLYCFHFRLQLGITPASPHAVKVLCSQSQSEGC